MRKNGNKSLYLFLGPSVRYVALPELPAETLHVADHGILELEPRVPAQRPVSEHPELLSVHDVVRQASDRGIKNMIDVAGRTRYLYSILYANTVGRRRSCRMGRRRDGAFNGADGGRMTRLRGTTV